MAPIFIPSYQEALQRAKIARLEERRNELCMRTFDDIVKGRPSLKLLTPIRRIADDYTFGRFFEYVKLTVLGEASSALLS